MKSSTNRIGTCLSALRGITKEFYEGKLKQYETDLNKIEDKLSKVDETDKSFYVTAGYIVQTAKHSDELFSVLK